MKQEFETAWGSSIGGDANKTLVVNGSITAKPILVIDPTIKLVIDKLKTIAATLETDISHFSTFKGQSMAINRFSFLKREILDNVARLEKACPIK